MKMIRLIKYNNKDFINKMLKSKAVIKRKLIIQTIFMIEFSTINKSILLVIQTHRNFKIFKIGIKTIILLYKGVLDVIINQKV